MKKYSWIVALLLALTLGFVFASCDNGYGGDGKDPRKVAGQGPGPVGPTGPQVGDVVIELADLIGSTAVGDAIATLPAPFSKSGSPTVTVTANGVEVSARTADYHGLNVSLAGLDFTAYEYVVEFGGYTTPVDSDSGAGVKIGQPGEPYSDLLALPTVTPGTPAVSPATDLSPVFGPPPGQMSMRVAAATIPYASGHTEDFTITKFVIKIKTVL